MGSGKREKGMPRRNKQRENFAAFSKENKLLDYGEISDTFT
jgi:hypothetical protein